MPKITLKMHIKNEADRYLIPMLESVREYIDEAVILDDHSTDNSVEIVRELLKGIPLILEVYPDTFFFESNLHNKLMDMIIPTKPEWILCLDADEILENRAKYDLRKQLEENNHCTCICFHQFEMWDEVHYRTDNVWGKTPKGWVYRGFKYEEGKKYWWHPMGHHVERIPDGIKGNNEFHSDIRLKHYGWIKNKEEKLKRYKEHFEHYKFGYFPHIWNTLLDKNPTLELFEEE